jgi:serine/threonine-protein kinase
MEYLAGENLGRQVREGRAGDLRQKLHIARQIAGALAYVHSKGIVHRDVKPDNIRVDAAGNVKLMDFGIAKSEELSLTGAGFTVGTPYYMAPEQIRGWKPTRLVDVYAFGVLLYELVTGVRPFEGGTVDEIFDVILNQPLDLGPLARASAPDALSNLIQELTEKDPARRPQDFAVVLRSIDSICV